MPYSVLIVDDNPKLVSSLAILLSTLDLVDRVYQAYDRSSAIEIVLNHDVDVALIDYLLEGYDGLSLAFDIKQVKPGIKIAILSVVDETRRFKNSRYAWVDDWITKSIDLNPIYEFLYRFHPTKV